MAGVAEIQVRWRCERCDGGGRIPYQPVGGIPVPGSETQLCPDCNGEKFVKQKWVPIAELEVRLARRFAERDPQSLRAST